MLLGDLVDVIVLYAWRHPPAYAKFPLDKARPVAAAWQRFLMRPGQWDLLDDLSDRNEPKLTSADVGRVGLYLYTSVWEWSAIFVIVWVHPSGQRFGIIFPSVSNSNAAATTTLQITDALYPVILLPMEAAGAAAELMLFITTTSTTTTTRTDGSNDCIELVQTFDPRGFYRGAGGAPSPGFSDHCHTVSTYWSFDYDWWNKTDMDHKTG
jgi:hypothetical protein